MDWLALTPGNLSIRMFVHSKMYNPQFHLYPSSHHNLPSTYHFDEMFSSRSTTRNPLPSSTDSAVSVTLSCVGRGPFGSPSSLAFMVAASPCFPPHPTSLGSLPFPFRTPFVGGVHHSSIYSPQLFPLCTHSVASPRPMVPLTFTQMIPTHFFPIQPFSELSSERLAPPAGFLKNLHFNASTMNFAPVPQIHLCVPSSHPNQKPGSHCECHLFHHLFHPSHH